MATLTPRERRHRRTRKAILSTARHIINEEGPANLSIRELARRIDYSPAGLYEYFGSKDEIIQAVCNEGHERLTAALAQACDPEQDPGAQLLAIGQAYVDFAVRNPDYYALMFATPPEEAGYEEIVQEGSSFGILLRVIQNGIDAGVFAPRPGFERMGMAYAAWATVHGIAMLRTTYLKNAPLDFDTAGREALLAFGRGLMQE